VLSKLIAKRSMTMISNRNERDNVVMLLDELLPTSDPIVQVYCDFQAGVLDIYDRENDLAFSVDIP
jgi:hypothetical protein